ncbi:MAG: glycoside hydrolase family 76 protein [Vicinamibacteria bacterium]
MASPGKRLALMNPHLARAVAAAEVLTSNWFADDAPSFWVPEDYWRAPTILMELVGLMAATGQPDHVAVVENGRIAGEPYLGNCGYYDDETVWGRFFVAAHAYFREAGAADPAPYLADAVAVYQDLTAAWDASADVCGGGVWWMRPSPSTRANFKAANATLGLMEIALGLFEATADASYLARAQAAWSWLQSSGLMPADGLVWGGLTAACGVDPRNVPVIALQGNPLGPLFMLYEATGDTSCLDAAQRIADATLDSATVPPMVWPGTSVLMASLDAVWDAHDETWRVDNAGITPFKGIFAGFLGEFARGLAASGDPARRAAAARYAAALAASSDTLAANYPGGMYSMDWHTLHDPYEPDVDPQLNASLQYSGLAVFLAAARASS